MMTADLQPPQSLNRGRCSLPERLDGSPQPSYIYIYIYIIYSIMNMSTTFYNIMAILTYFFHDYLMALLPRQEQFCGCAYGTWPQELRV